MKSPSQTRGTLAYFKYKTWSNLNNRTINGGHPSLKDGCAQRYLRQKIELRFTKGEFYAWCDTQKEIILGFYESGDTPSIDRIGLHYELDNLRVISLKTNASDGRSKAFKKLARPIVGHNILTGEQIRFPSIRAAESAGFSNSHIGKCLHGLYKQHRGYRWSLEGESNG